MYPALLDTRGINGLKFGPQFCEKCDFFFSGRGKAINNIIIERFQIYIGNETKIKCMELSVFYSTSLYNSSEGGLPQSCSNNCYLLVQTETGSELGEVS